MSNYTDYFSNTINVGDEIIFPTSYGELSRTRVEKLVPLVPHPAYTGATGNTQYCRQDKLNQAHPTPYSNYWGLYDDPSKRFVAVTRQDPGEHGNYDARALVRVENIVLVPAGA